MAAAALRWGRRQDADHLVFVDESRARLAVGRSHVWVKRGEEHAEPRPMNWGDTLTLAGAPRRQGWVRRSTQWRAMTRSASVIWVPRCLASRLRRDDSVLLDDLAARHAPEVRRFVEQCCATLRFLPP